MHAYMHTCIGTYIRTYNRTCVYIYMYMYTHYLLCWQVWGHRSDLAIASLFGLQHFPAQLSAARNVQPTGVMPTTTRIFPRFSPNFVDADKKFQQSHFRS